MYLASASFTDLPGFAQLEVPFVGSDGEPRLMNVVHGAGGVGKTTLLSTIAATRPGHAVALYGGSLGPAPRARCEWLLGQDDPERPHPLIVATPLTGRNGPEDEQTVLARREQALYERRTKDGGFVFLLLPSSRWFSRQAVVLQAPMRTVAHYDVRAGVTPDDATRNDLTRDTKQALAYAAIAAALVPHTQRGRNELRAQGHRLNVRQLGTAIHDTVNQFLGLTGYTYDGLDPLSLEPIFTSRTGRRRSFEGLPTHSRHLVAMAALTVRNLWAAYPGVDPRESEAVIAIDDADLFQDDATQEQLPTLLRESLPKVQWILTTSSAVLASSARPSDLLTLRRLGDDEQVGLFVGAQALTH